MAVGLFKFEYEVVQKCPFIDSRDKQEGKTKNYSLVQFISDASRKWSDAQGNWGDDGLEAYSRGGEKADGPTMQVVLYGDTGQVLGQLAGDAPRTPYPYFGNKWPGKIGGYRYYFKATWRVHVEDNDNAWEGKFRVEYEFSDQSPSAGKGSMTLLDPPHKVKCMRLNFDSLAVF
jgi:hypothetical protein